MMKLSELKTQILASLRTANTIGIMSHVNPDGDGFCTSLALQQLLRIWAYDSDIVTDPGNFSNYEHLMEGARLRLYDPLLSYDLLFTLDCNSLDRVGERASLIDKSRIMILIDHHEVEHRLIKADVSYIDTGFVSAGAIIFRCFQDEITKLDEALRLPVLNCLYTTILNDTNNFANANTNAEVFRAVADMAALGINPSRLYKQYFLNQSAEEMRYTGEVLSTIELHLNRRLLMMHSTLQMLNSNHLDADAVMNITRWVQGVKGIDAIVYLREEEPGLYKLSLRSVNLDVNKIANLYGGGGHRSASGAHVKGSLDSIKHDLISLFDSALKDYDAGF